MKISSAILVILAAALYGCDSSSDGDDNGNGIFPDLTKIVYEVAGTYRTCDITYHGESQQEVLLVDEPLDWSDSLSIEIDGTFLARLTATCADVERDGKATLTIRVDGELRASGDAQGFGDSGEAQFLVQR